MACCTISTGSFRTLPPEFILKQRPFEFSLNETLLSDSNTDAKLNEVVVGDFKSPAAKDCKFHGFVPHLLALKRIQAYMKEFLEDKAKEVDEEDDEEESEESEEEEETRILVPLPVVQWLRNREMINKIEMHSLVLKLWLRRIHLTSRSNKEEGRKLQDFEHAIYDAQQVITQVEALDLKEDDNIEEFEVLLRDYDDRLERAFDKTVEEKQSVNFTMTEEDGVRFFSDSVRLCSLLGLRLDFLDRLQEIAEEIRGHYITSDWIANFFQENYELLSTSDKVSLSRDLLVSIGFDPMSTATEKILARAGNIVQHVEAYEWAEIFIKDEFKYNLLLSPQYSRFPFRSDLTNKWFQLPRITEQEEKDEDPRHVNIINLVTKECEIYRNQFELSNFPQQLEDDEHVVLFHGTDHQSACDILSEGIDLYLGRQKRDFSSGSGFYLTKSFDDARDWAKSTTSKPSVLVFSVECKCLSKANRLVLHGNSEKWHELVQSFRKNKLTAQMRKKLSAYDAIEGPTASITRSELSSELSIEPRDSSHQMCLISDDFAEEFHQCLHSILFYK